MEEEKIILHICPVCDEEFIEYDSRHRKYCSRECYYKTLKEHGKTLFRNYGRVVLIHLQNLRDDAWNLGFRPRYWWKTTKQQLLDYVNKAKQVAINLYNQSKRKICDFCGSNMTLYQGRWWCECGANGPP